MLSDAIEFFEAFIDPHTWVRVGFIVLGGVLILLALKGSALSERSFSVGRSMGIL